MRAVNISKGSNKRVSKKDKKSDERVSKKDKKSEKDITVVKNEN